MSDAADKDWQWVTLAPVECWNCTVLHEQGSWSLNQRNWGPDIYLLL